MSVLDVLKFEKTKTSQPTLSQKEWRYLVSQVYKKCIPTNHHTLASHWSTLKFSLTKTDRQLNLD